VKQPENFQKFTHFILLTHLFPDAGEIPNNVTDMLWATFCFFIQFYIAALTLGTMLNYLVRRDPVEDAYKKRLDSVRQYMITKSIPSELHERVVLYCQFQHRKDQQNAVSQRCSFYVLLCMCERMHSDLTFICAYIMKQHAITTLFEPPSRQCQL
jgi:hypothetical protein